MRTTSEWGIGTLGTQHWAGRSALASSEAGEGAGSSATQSIHSSAVGPPCPKRSSPQSVLCAQASTAAVTLLRPLLSHCGGASRPYLPSAWRGGAGGEQGGGHLGQLPAWTQPAPSLCLAEDGLQRWDVFGLEGEHGLCQRLAV